MLVFEPFLQLHWFGPKVDRILSITDKKELPGLGCFVRPFFLSLGIRTAIALRSNAKIPVQLIDVFRIGTIRSTWIIESSKLRDVIAVRVLHRAFSLVELKETATGHVLPNARA